MFGSSDNNEETLIAASLKIEGKVIADGFVRVHGKINGDLQCTSLVIGPNAEITGSVSADSVVVDGRVEGPIRGDDVVLKSQAHVLGDIYHTSLSMDKGAVFDGRSKMVDKEKKAALEKKADAKTDGASASSSASSSSSAQQQAKSTKAA
ncbi:MAG: polymer-forming cytoskeletal protein [Hyphomicrobiaceae bacterium]|nr:polymer-forming cytoskeletal protein [Hyphomicrobiaceae bacterium]